MIFSEQILHLFGNQHSSISLVLCQTEKGMYLREGKMEQAEWKKNELKLLGFIQGCGFYLQKCTRNGDL